ncbi:MAG: hypothetical protein KC423_27045 [Anaerolineales bacterium]|nr:hypothetical protein [Anaerolineales bacterium]
MVRFLKLAPRRLALVFYKTAVTRARRPGEKAGRSASFNPGHPAPTIGFGMTNANREKRS